MKDKKIELWTTENEIVRLTKEVNKLKLEELRSTVWLVAVENYKLKRALRKLTKKKKRR